MSVTREKPKKIVSFDCAAKLPLTEEAMGVHDALNCEPELLVRSDSVTAECGEIPPYQPGNYTHDRESDQF